MLQREPAPRGVSLLIFPRMRLREKGTKRRPAVDALSIAEHSLRSNRALYFTVRREAVCRCAENCESARENRKRMKEGRRKNNTQPEGAGCSKEEPKRCCGFRPGVLRAAHASLRRVHTGSALLRPLYLRTSPVCLGRRSARWRPVPLRASLRHHRVPQRALAVCSSRSPYVLCQVRRGFLCH